MKKTGTIQRLAWGILLLATICLTAMADMGKDDVMVKMNRASELMKTGKFEEASAQYLDPIIAEFEKTYGNHKARVYCSNSSVETVLYLMQSAKNKEEAIAVGGAYAYAYFLKGYIAVERHDAKSGLILIGKAVELTPSNPQFLSELANIYQDQKNWTVALELYERAIEGAKLLEEKGNTFYLRRALRGKGYVYVELGKYDESEKMYQECLRLDATDKVAIGELGYVERERAKAKK